MSGLRENSDQICSVIQVSVKGDPDEFKNWVKNRSSKYVLELNEEKLISYEWHFSDDGREATLVELLVDSEKFINEEFNKKCHYNGLNKMKEHIYNCIFFTVQKN